MCDMTCIKRLNLMRTLELVHEKSLAGAVSSAQSAVPALLPPFAADARGTPEEVRRIHRSLNLEQSVIVAAPESLLPILFIRESLQMPHPAVSATVLL